MADQLIRVYRKDGSGFKLAKSEADVFKAANPGSYFDGETQLEQAAREFRREQAAAAKAKEEGEAEDAKAATKKA